MQTIEEIKSLDLVSFVSSYAGSPADKSGKWIFFHSPFRDERTASFAVNTDKNTWADFGAPEDVRGDIYDFVLYLHNRRTVKTREDWLEASRLITGNGSSKAMPRQRDVKRIEFRKDNAATDKRVNMEHVKSCAAKADPYAIEYFMNRHISPETVCQKLIGVDFERPYRYEFTDGSHEFFSTRRFTIPYVTGNHVRKLAERRDDFAARMQISILQDKDPELFERVLIDIAKRSLGKYTPLSVPQDVLIDKLFGRKYLRPGTGNWVFNAERLIRVENGEIVMHNNRPVLNPLLYVLVTEGEINAMTAEDAGFPAVAAKFGFPVNPGTKVFVVADRDGNGAGEEYATYTAKAIPNAEIIYPPAGFNDMNDLELAGKLHKWLEGYGIFPMWERRFK